MNSRRWILTLCLLWPIGSIGCSGSASSTSNAPNIVPVGSISGTPEEQKKQVEEMGLLRKKHLPPGYEPPAQ